MSLGLTEADIAYIVKTVSEFPKIQKACVFGSRAKANYRVASDVDIAIFGDDIDFTTIANLKAELEETSPLPYKFDVVNYHTTTNQELKDHIDRVGVVIFTRNC